MTGAVLLEGRFDDSALVHLKSTLLRQDRLVGLISAGSREIAVATKLFVAFGSFVEESRELPFPDKLDFTDRTISLFRDDDFRLPLVLFGPFTSVIVPFSVHEHNDVGILLDRP